MKIILRILVGLAYTSLASANIANYNPPEIMARANIHDGYNIPPMSFLNNTSPVINNHGDIAFKIMSADGQNNQVLWVKTAEESAGKIVYSAPDERFLTDPSINDSGKIAFNLYDEGVTDGLFIYDSKTLNVEQVLNPDEQTIQYYTYPKVLNNNHIFFRGTDDANDRSFYEFTGTKLTRILVEGVETAGIKASYLFRPSVNEAGQIAFKVRLGEKGQWEESNPDAILILTPSSDPKFPGMKVTTVAHDHDGDSHSLYTKFGNSVSISKHGAIVFTADLQTGKKVIAVYKDNIVTNIAIEGQNDISEIEQFAPKINDQGLVLFRARDMSGKRGLFLADGVTIKKIITEGEEIQTDLGIGKILSNPNYPGFGGEVDMNDQGEIVFYCLVVSEDNKELGSAVYKISPKK
ncbi:MAG: hypothetical protein Q7U04_07525 [Bacteriovorax sp.]|nr:hypothetical protein [Bacteriovorax sp.]